MRLRVHLGWWQLPRDQGAWFFLGWTVGSLRELQSMGKQWRAPLKEQAECRIPSGRSGRITAG